MPEYNLRGALQNGPLYATSVLTGSPIVIEALRGAAFAALLLDMEHSTLTSSAVEEIVRAADVHRTPLIVRVPEIGVEIARVLDAGAAGIMVPQVESADQAREVVARARYAPIGQRGLGAARGSVYGATLGPTFTAEANDRTLVVVQIESATGVENADAILATPGLDAVVIGPADLSMSLGVPMGAPVFWHAVERVFAAARSNGVAPGTFCFRDGDLREFLDRGAALILAGSDISWLLQGAAEQRAQLQRAEESKGVVR